MMGGVDNSCMCSPCFLHWFFDGKLRPVRFNHSALNKHHHHHIEVLYFYHISLQKAKYLCTNFLKIGSGLCMMENQVLLALYVPSSPH